MKLLGTHQGCRALEGSRSTGVIIRIFDGFTSFSQGPNVSGFVRAHEQIGKVAVEGSSCVLGVLGAKGARHVFKLWEDLRPRFRVRGLRACSSDGSFSIS